MTDWIKRLSRVSLIFTPVNWVPIACPQGFCQLSHAQWVFIEGTDRTMSTREIIVQHQIQVRRFVDFDQAKLDFLEAFASHQETFKDLGHPDWQAAHPFVNFVESVLLKREQLLLQVTEATTCLLISPSLEAALPTVLGSLASAIAVDRLYVYECSDHPETKGIALGLRCEWRQPSAIPCNPFLHHHSENDGESTQWYEDICRGEVIQGTDLRLIRFIQQLHQQAHIAAVLMLPIFVEQKLWGYLGLDHTQSEPGWSMHEVAILTIAAKNIGAAIQRQQIEQQVRYQAFHDLLTGLPNRVLFNQQLMSEVELASQNNDLLAVMFLDLDHFKAINDTLGHTVGDQLLRQAARRLKGALRTQDLIARWGGDEFTLILPNLKTAEDARKIAQRLYEVLQSAFFIESHELKVQGSIGIAMFPEDGYLPTELIEKADAAMYSAKENGRNTCAFYASISHLTPPQCSLLEQSLRRAISNQEFILHYQPQLDLMTGEVQRIEALIRWQHPELGLVSPQTFIDTAESSGLIVPIGLWVLRRACQQNRAWQVLGLSEIRVSVNLSARQLQEPDLVDQISQVLKDTGLKAEHLELEITETAAMQDLDRATNVLQALCEMGLYISLDDFGTGYSSLSYLKKFPLQGLKIDRSFIQDMTGDEKDTAMLSAIITLGQGLGLNIVAEGVETIEQVNLLRSQHCYELQGNWFSPPLNPTEMTDFLVNRRCRAVLQSIDWQLPLLK